LGRRFYRSQDACGSLFADKAKYNAFMHAMASIIYREMITSSVTIRITMRFLLQNEIEKAPAP
jgi:hypothetical protein